MLTDAILVLVFSIGTAAILFKKEDEIEKWANSKHGRKLGWRE